MASYGILANPGHNRVYFEASKKLAEAELTLALSRMEIPCGSVRGREIAGVYYLTFQAEGELSAADIAALAQLSFLYALFRLEGEDGAPLLHPVLCRRDCYVGEDIGTNLKYTGKTNELFTRMLINTALFSAGHRDFQGLRLLDPVAGKGTTLFEGLIYGMDVYGVEVGDSPVREACQYFAKYLQTGKYKHSRKSERISGENRSFTAQRNSFQMAKDRQAERAGEYRRFEMIAGNSAYINRYYAKSFFDVIVGDLPYGVQHGNVTGEGQSALTRNPKELLKHCLPAWNGVLKRGGTLALSWNVNVLPREALRKLLEEAGFTPLEGGPYQGFSHRVDQAILRDVIVARK